MEEVALQFVTYDEKQREIRDRLIAIRKSRKITQRRLATMSGVTYASIRRFETTGDISFESFVKIAIALRLYNDLDNLFRFAYDHRYKSIKDAINDNKTRRND